MPSEQDADEVGRPQWRGREATFVPILGVVETVKHHYWNDVNDWRFYRHGEAHVDAEGIQ